MDKLICLKPFAERVARKNEKRTKLLRFLRQHLWSTAEVLKMVFDFKSSQATYKTLAQFEAEGIIRRYHYDLMGLGLTVWGITSHGQALAFDLQTETVCARYFEPSKCSEFTLRHTLDAQRLCLKAESIGWTAVINGDRLETIPAGHNRPDFIGVDLRGKKVAVEVERTIKTKKRYEGIVSSYLQAIRRGQYDRVVWVSPSTDLAVRLQQIILGIKRVSVSGQQVQIDPARHHKFLAFEDYTSFPVDRNVQTIS